MRSCKVIGKAVDASGAPVRRIVFVALDVGSASAIDARREVAVQPGEEGAFDVHLLPGRYRVHVGRSRVTITVPEESIARFETLVRERGEV